ncbi:MAG: 2-oxoglutarate and iron-dependent oxygenase domain-containing protein [Paracoccaceae bacterium]|nr:2-oxoglutarate and iron-dependent oxygenase domain-containing protein [Paracoccaceae bacterium]
MPTSDTPLPIVDIAGLASDDPAARAEVGRAIRAACEDMGFMYVVGHGIDEGLRADVLSEAAAFFALPLEEKMATDMKKSPCNRGYEEMGGQTLEADAPPDLKESFLMGAELAPDDPRVLAGKFNQGPNQWPAGRPGFEATMMRYHGEMNALGALMMRGVALSLDLPEDHFAPFDTDPVSILRLIHYPPQPPNPRPGEKGCGAHTDWGALTLLMQDDTGGLQVRAEDGNWIDAPHVPGSFVVNLGDMMARWTNDRYRSTEHRVINVSGRDRYSVPFFYEGNADEPVVCLPGCSSEADPPRYAPTTVEGHLKEMYARTYA